MDFLNIRVARLGYLVGATDTHFGVIGAVVVGGLAGWGAWRVGSYGREARPFFF